MSFVYYIKSPQPVLYPTTEPVQEQEKKEEPQKEPMIEPPVVKPTRCYKCNKKLGLCDMECSCSHSFCKKCRYPEEHGCTFDYKLQGKKQIEKANPMIVSSGFEKL
jgi:hypothetical protein